jgi:hypothetical protein
MTPRHASVRTRTTQLRHVWESCTTLDALTALPTHMPSGLSQPTDDVAAIEEVARLRSGRYPTGTPGALRARGPRDPKLSASAAKSA